HDAARVVHRGRVRHPRRLGGVEQLRLGGHPRPAVRPVRRPRDRHELHPRPRWRALQSRLRRPGARPRRRRPQGVVLGRLPRHAGRGAGQRQAVADRPRGGPGREAALGRHLAAAAAQAPGTGVRRPLVSARRRWTTMNDSTTRERMKMSETLTHLVGGEKVAGAGHFRDMDPYRGDVVCEAPEGAAADVDLAVAAAARAAPEVAAMPAYERAAILRRAAELVVERADEIGRIMAVETGKAIPDARAEVRRSTDTLSLSADEAIRIEGEHVPLDGSQMGHGKLAVITRFPVGVVGAITPFNAPFNLACHKLGPSFAAGNATVIKPP